MTTPRSKKIDLEATPFYHCVARCVRRAFLYGKDLESKKDYSHRKTWILNRIKKLSGVFAINICAYAIMSNHYHLVLHVDVSQAKSWSDDDVQARWKQLFPNDANQLETLPKEIALKKIELWRDRLSSISWFMRCLNEYIARLSNSEDECTGRFWEGRFKSQALLDEGAVLSAMAYVDLNPIRANTARTPEESVFTSIYERIKFINKKLKKSGNTTSLSSIEIGALCDQAKQPECLMPFSTNKVNHTPSIDFKLVDYLQLVDETGRLLRKKKSGAISTTLSPILSRLNLKHQTWLDMIKNLEENFFYSIGQPAMLLQFSKHHTCSPRGINAAKKFYCNVA